MALSGSLTSTGGYSGRNYTLSWTATQSVANNTSTIKWTLEAVGGTAGWYAERTLKVDIAGNTVFSKTNYVERYKGVVATGTLTLTHDSTGAKSFSASIQATVYYASGINSSGSKTFTLDTIPRKSTLTVGNGTLGTAQALTVTRQSSSFTHTITATCGSASTTICTKSSSTSISFTPPIAWASQNTTGTSVAVKYTITTYSGTTSVGSNAYSKTCTIPASVIPSCKVSVSDPTGYLTKYGAYIKGKSKFAVVVTPTTAYGSAIATYKTTANGMTYSSASFTTGVLKSSGSLTVKTTVTDKRGRAGSASTALTVLDYLAPRVSKLVVRRCDANGTANDQGECVQVEFSAAVTSLGSKNTSSYTLRYKRSTDSTYTSVTLSDYTNVYTLTDVTYIFPAETGSSYDVQLSITDAFGTVTSNTSASTAFTLMHFKADGTGMAIGKVSEEPNMLDIGLPTRFNQPVCGKVMGLDKLPEIPRNSDFNDYMEPGCYAVYANEIAGTIANMPVDKAGRLEVTSSTGEGILVSRWSYIRQRFITYHEALGVWERDITRDSNNIWTYGGWWRSSLTAAASKKVYHEQKVLWEGGYYMSAAQTAFLAEPISAQANGIVLVFCRYSSGTVQNYHYNSFFVPKIQISKHGGCGHTFMLTTEGTFSVMATKYVYIHDDQIVGNDQNEASGSASGITYDNAGFVLRYVYGV